MFLWRIYLIWKLLLLLLDLMSLFMFESTFVTHIETIRSSLIRLHGFHQLLWLLVLIRATSLDSASRIDLLEELLSRSNR